MIKWEAGNSKEHYTVRSSDFDNSITYFNNFQRKWLSLESYYKYTWKKLHDKIKETNEWYVMKRMFVWVQSDKTLFDITWRIEAANDKASDDELRVIWIDMWGLEDMLWVCIFNVSQLIIEQGYSHKIENYQESLSLILLCYIFLYLL